MFYWSKENVKVLRDMWDDASSRQIAERLGTTRNAVLGKAYRLGLNGKKPMSKKRHTILKKIRKTNKATQKPNHDPNNVGIGLPLSHMQPGMCYYPIQDDPPRFCAMPCKKNYCDHHLKIMRPK